MAADVTLLTMPNTPENWETAEYRLYQKLFPTDEALTDPNDGQILGYCSMLPSGDPGDLRENFDQWFYETADYDMHEVGPWSPAKAGWLGNQQRWMPSPTVAVYRLTQTPRVITPGFVGAVMAALNLPDHSHYKTWNPRGTGRGKQKWRPNRPARARGVKRFLTSHIGDIVWTESW